MSFPTYLRIYYSTYLLAYWPLYLPTYLPTYLSIYPPIYPPIYLPTYPPTRLPTDLPVRLPLDLSYTSAPYTKKPPPRPPLTDNMFRGEPGNIDASHGIVPDDVIAAILNYQLKSCDADRAHVRRNK